MKIADDVQNQFNEWSARWKGPLSSASPLLELDGEWPSIGVLDLLLSNLRGVAELPEFERELLRGASTYLAVLAGKCWSRRGVSVTIENGKEGVLVRAGGGVLASGEEIVLDLEKELAAVLRSPVAPVPVLNGFDRFFGPDQNVLSAFALGVMLGMTPTASGPWSSTPPEQLREHIQVMVLELSESCVRWYRRVSPTEVFGQDPRLYSRGLVFPPILLAESIPGVTGALSAIAHAKEQKLPLITLHDCSRTLANCADELLGTVGLALAAATAGRQLSGALLAKASSQGTYMGLLRQSMCEAREALGLRRDWLEENEFTEEDRLQAQHERSMGMLPWVVLPLSRFADAKLRELLFSLSVFQWEKAVELNTKLLMESPGDIDLRIQRIELDIVAANYDVAIPAIRSLLTEPGCESNFQIFNQWATCELGMGNVEGAFVKAERSYQLLASESPERGRIANDYGWVLLMAGRFEEALAAFAVGLERFPEDLPLLMNKAFALQSMGRTAELREVENLLLRLAPSDRRVFHNAIMTKI